MFPNSIRLSLKTLLYLSFVNRNDNSSIIITPWIATISTYNPAFSGINVDNNLTYIFGCPSVFIDRQAVLTSFACYNNYFSDQPIYVDFYNYKYSVNEVIVRNISLNKVIDDNLALFIFSNEEWNPKVPGIIKFPITENEINWDNCKLIQYPLNSRRFIFNFFHIHFVQSNECKRYINRANQYDINQNVTWSPNLLCSTLLSKTNCLKMRRYSPVVCQQKNDYKSYMIVAFSSKRMLTLKRKCFVLFQNIVSVSSWLHYERAKLTWTRFLKSIST